MNQRTPTYLTIVGCYDLLGSTQNKYLIVFYTCHVQIDQDLMNPIWKTPFSTQSVEPGCTLCTNDWSWSTSSSILLFASQYL